jgi:hypothetical protein
VPIALEDGFYFTHDLTHGSCLGIDSRCLGDCIAMVKTRRIKGVFGHPRYGFAGQDVDFLVDIPWIEAVWFWDCNLKNIDGLYLLTELQHFQLSPKRPAVDFSKFPKLRSAVVEPKTRDRGLSLLKQLELLHIWHYRPKQKDFTAFEFPDSLSELQLNWANVSSLESLPRLPELRRLEVHRCFNLEFLGDLAAKFPRLEHLVVDACGRVRCGEGERAIRDLPNLKHAWVRDAKLI